MNHPRSQTKEGVLVAPDEDPPPYCEHANDVAFVFGTAILVAAIGGTLAACVIRYGRKFRCE